MAEVNWTIITFLLIGLFALAGFYKGWWKEGITAIFLTFLVFLWLFPNVAWAFIEAINIVIAFIWGLFSEVYRIFFADVLEASLGVETGNGPPRIDAGDPQTWIIMLIIFLGLAIVVSRWSLPSYGRLSLPYYGYPVTCSGRFFGSILGAINGFLIISLVRAYLNGSNLPGVASDQTAASTAGDVVIQAVEVPRTTILDSYLPWFFIALGIFILILAVRSRVVIESEKGFRKVDYRAPLGYRKIDVVVKDA